MSEITDRLDDFMVYMIDRGNDMEAQGMYRHLRRLIEAQENALGLAIKENTGKAEALSDLLDVIDASPYGEESLHHHTCPSPDHGKCTCGAYAAVDAARKALREERQA